MERLDLFVITALAVYRVWRLVAKDTITERWREAAFNRWPPTASRAAGTMTWNPALRQHVYRVRPTPAPTRKVSWIAAGVVCAWCGGAWLSAVATALVDASVGVRWPVAWFLALSTAVGLLGRAEGS